MSMRRVLLALGSIGLVVVIACGGGSSENGGPAPTPTPTPPAVPTRAPTPAPTPTPGTTPAPRVTQPPPTLAAPSGGVPGAVPASQIVAEFKLDPVAAEAKYKGKTLTLSGLITDFGTDLVRGPFVQLDSGVDCYGPRAEAARFESVHKDDPITVSGTFERKFFAVELSGCKILS